MERQQILDLMNELKLVGMKATFDEVLANGLKRQHPVQQIIGDLLAAEIAEKQARSIRYQIAAAKLPLAKEMADFDFSGTPINESLLRDLATGGFLAQQRGPSGTGRCRLGPPWAATFARQPQTSCAAVSRVELYCLGRQQWRSRVRTRQELQWRQLSDGVAFRGHAANLFNPTCADNPIDC